MCEQQRPDPHAIRLANLGATTDAEFEAHQQDIDSPAAEPEQEEQEAERWDGMG